MSTCYLWCVQVPEARGKQVFGVSHYPRFISVAVRKILIKKQLREDRRFEAYNLRLLYYFREVMAGT